MPIELAYYADDFTGATDALECVVRSGRTARLYTTAPSPAELARDGHVDVVGVAGRSRALPTEEIDAEVRPALQALARLEPRFLHYKICSTFDSSPTIGSIGRVAEIGCELFSPSFVPLLAGAPHLGRWCVFGNLFARQGIGSQGVIQRLDRLPAARGHSTTAMTEADLRLHLGQQTDLPIELVDVLQLDQRDDLQRAFDAATTAERSIVLFDTLTAAHLGSIGDLLRERAINSATLFCIGSSAVEAALLKPRQASTHHLPSDAQRHTAPLLVVSGSCSPITQRQIKCATAAGFASFAVEPEMLADDSTPQLVELHKGVQTRLSAGHNTVVHTCLGHDDPRREQFPQSVPKSALASRIGHTLGSIVKYCQSASVAFRLCVAGGDTASYTARALGITCLSLFTYSMPGAPWCIAHQAETHNPLLVVFKGGQVGGENYLTELAQQR